MALQPCKRRRVDLPNDVLLVIDSFVDKRLIIAYEFQFHCRYYSDPPHTSGWLPEIQWSVCPVRSEVDEDDDTETLEQSLLSGVYKQIEPGLILMTSSTAATPDRCRHCHHTEEYCHHDGWCRYQRGYDH